MVEIYVKIFSPHNKELQQNILRYSLQKTCGTKAWKLEKHTETETIGL